MLLSGRRCCHGEEVTAVAAAAALSLLKICCKVWGMEDRYEGFNDYDHAYDAQVIMLFDSFFKKLGASLHFSRDRFAIY